MDPTTLSDQQLAETTQACLVEIERRIGARPQDGTTKSLARLVGIAHRALEEAMDVAVGGGLGVVPLDGTSKPPPGP